MTKRPNRAIIYRPAHGIGIGHLVYCLAGYSTLARHLNRDFIFTIAGTVFDLLGSEADFLTRYFDTTPLNATTVHYGIAAVHHRLTQATTHHEHIAVLGREDRRLRPGTEFALLQQADFFECPYIGDLALADLDAVDALYVDSVVDVLYHEGVNFDPTAALPFGKLTPLMTLKPDYLAAVAGVLGRDHIGLHVRHGNGEGIGNRMSGADADFDRYLESLATAARTHARQTGLTDIVVISDNPDAARRLATLSGGRSVGSDHLPDRFFGAFLRSDTTKTAARIDKLMWDYAVLAGSRHIVSGQSLFSKSAHLLSGQGRHIVIAR